MLLGYLSTPRHQHCFSPNGQRNRQLTQHTLEEPERQLFQSLAVPHSYHPSCISLWSQSLLDNKKDTHFACIVPSHPILCHELNTFSPQPLTNHQTIGYVMSVMRNCHRGKSDLPEGR